MAYLHIPGVRVTADFDRSRTFRYRMDIMLAAPSARTQTACVVMQNPSYASESVADKSVQFMEKNVFLRGLPGFSGVRRLIVVNQFARIQTRDFEGRRSEIGPRNDKTLREVLRESDIIILGWGKSNPFVERQRFVLEELRKLRDKKLFQTRMHPSRGRYENFILPFVL